jgi:PAS domain S-box-containing protein
VTRGDSSFDRLKHQGPVHGEEGGASRGPVLDPVLVALDHLTSEADWNDALVRALRGLAETVGASAAALVQIEERRSGRLAFDVRAAFGRPPIEPGILDSWLRARVESLRRGVVIEGEIPPPAGHGAAPGALAAVPVTRDRWWGALVLRFDHAPPRWDPEARQALRWVGRLAGWAAERERAESDLREAQVRYRDLAESLPGIAYIHTDGDDKEFLYMSPQVEELLGYGPELWLRHPAFGLTLVHPKDLARMQAACHQPAPSHMEVAVFRQIARDGRVVTVCDASVLRPPPTGGPAVWTGVCLDVGDLTLASEGVQAVLAQPPVRIGSRAIEAVTDPLAVALAAPRPSPLPPHLAGLVEAARAYLLEHLAEPLDLARLSRAVALSPSYLSRLFRAHVGEPPHRYLTRLRLELAQELLRTSSLSVARIAARAGFATPSHFVATFRAHLGTTPGQYRRNLESGGRSPGIRTSGA